MIVKKPIGSVKIGKTVSRLTVGKPVPSNVLEFWKKTKQLEGLIKAGAIVDEKETKPEPEPQGSSKGTGKEEKK